MISTTFLWRWAFTVVANKMTLVTYRRVSEAYWEWFVIIIRFVGWYRVSVSIGVNKKRYRVHGSGVVSGNKGIVFHVVLFETMFPILAFRVQFLIQSMNLSHVSINQFEIPFKVQLAQRNVFQTINFKVLDLFGKFALQFGT
jgi:hypothetical protein